MNPGLIEVMSKGSESFRRLNAGLLRGFEDAAMAKVPKPRKSKANHLPAHAHTVPSNHPPLVARLPDPEPQRVHREEQVRDAAAPQEGTARTCVIITRCSASSLDRDNLIGGAKATCDGLRYCGLIDGDTERHIELFVFQKRVKRKDSGTLIEILRLP